jgi:hypothetical protein
MAGPADHWPPTVGAFWFHYWSEFWLQFWAARIAAQRAALLGVQLARRLGETLDDRSCTSSGIENGNCVMLFFHLPLIIFETMLTVWDLFSKPCDREATVVRLCQATILSSVQLRSLRQRLGLAITHNRDRRPIPVEVRPHAAPRPQSAQFQMPKECRICASIWSTLSVY